MVLVPSAGQYPHARAPSGNGFPAALFKEPSLTCARFTSTPSITRWSSRAVRQNPHGGPAARVSERGARRSASGIAADPSALRIVCGIESTRMDFVSPPSLSSRRSFMGCAKATVRSICSKKPRCRSSSALNGRRKTTTATRMMSTPTARSKSATMRHHLPQSFKKSKIKFCVLHRMLSTSRATFRRQSKKPSMPVYRAEDAVRALDAFSVAEIYVMWRGSHWLHRALERFRTREMSLRAGEVFSTTALKSRWSSSTANDSLRRPSRPRQPRPNRPPRNKEQP